MDWIEIAVPVLHTATEAVADIFTELGSGGVLIEDPREVNFYIKSGFWDYTDLMETEDTGVSVVKAYLPKNDRLKEKLVILDAAFSCLEERLPGALAGEMVFRQVGEEDWESSWKKYFHPLRIGRHIVIKPTWEEYAAETDDLIVQIDPGMAFGTGTHHTTCLCIEKLEKLVQPGLVVFDVGTGSGILSLVCARLGAARVRAVDLDPVAVKIARENIMLNELQEIVTVCEGDLLTAVKGEADIIVANIVADVISVLLPDIALKLTKNGMFLASGIISERVEEIKTKAGFAGLTVVETLERDGWDLLVMRKK